MPRLNARVDDDGVRKIELLKSRDSASTTEILKAAIEHYFEARQKLVGIASGPKNLSSDYKEQMTAGLSKKT